MIHCFGSKGKNINTKTVWTNLRNCKEYVGEHISFVTRDGLDALVCFNLGIKKQILVYVAEKNKSIMTPDSLIDELRERFRISIVELRKGIQDYEVEMYCNALGITETILFWAIKNYKPNKKQEHLKTQIYPTKENRGN